MLSAVRHRPQLGCRPREHCRTADGCLHRLVAPIAHGAEILPTWLKCAQVADLPSCEIGMPLTAFTIGFRSRSLSTDLGAVLNGLQGACATMARSTAARHRAAASGMPAPWRCCESAGGIAGGDGMAALLALVDDLAPQPNITHERTAIPNTVARTSPYIRPSSWISCHRWTRWT